MLTHLSEPWLQKGIYIFKAYLTHIEIIKHEKRQIKTGLSQYLYLPSFSRISPFVFLNSIIHRLSPQYASLSVWRKMSFLISPTSCDGHCDLGTLRVLLPSLPIAFPLDPLSDACCLCFNFVDSAFHCAQVLDCSVAMFFNFFFLSESKILILLPNRTTDFHLQLF